METQNSTATVISNPLLIPEIVHHIFEFLCPSSPSKHLLKLRPICKTWNSEAIRTIKANEKAFSNPTCQVNYSKHGQKEFQKIQTLTSLLEKSLNPSVLLSQFEMKFPVDSQWRPQIDSFLKKYGHHFKSLYLSNATYPHPLFQILNQHCPNVLNIFYDRFANISISPNQNCIPHSSKIKQLHFKTEEAAARQPLKFYFEILASYLNSCPNLQILGLQTHITETVILNVENNFTGHVNVNENNSVDAKTEEILEHLMNIQLERKITAVSLHYNFSYVTQYEMIVQYPNFLYNFLQKYGQSLENFELYDDMCSLQKQPFSYFLNPKNLLVMPNLKRLTISNVCLKNENLNILEKMPNLQVLYIVTNRGFCGKQQWIGSTFSKMSLLHPIKNLQELNIEVLTTFDCLQAIKSMVGVFPNVKKVYLGISSPFAHQTLPPWPCIENWLVEALTGIAEIKNLQHVTLNFRGKVWSFGQDQVEALTALKEISIFSCSYVLKLKNLSVTTDPYPPESEFVNPKGVVYKRSKKYKNRAENIFEVPTLNFLINHLIPS